MRELKDLLDEKDEKIDMLSRIHSFSAPSRRASASLSPARSVEEKTEPQTTPEESLHIESPAPAATLTSLPGPTSTAAFIGAQKRNLRSRVVG